MNYPCFLGDKTDALRLDEKQHGCTKQRFYIPFCRINIRRVFCSNPELTLVPIFNVSLWEFHFILLISLWPGPGFIGLLVSSGIPCKVTIPIFILALYYILANFTALTLQRVADLYLYGYENYLDKIVVILIRCIQKQNFDRKVLLFDCKSVQSDVFSYRILPRILILIAFL